MHTHDNEYEFLDSRTKGKLPVIEKRVKIQSHDKNWKRTFENFCNQYAQDMPDFSNISHEVDNLAVFYVHVPGNTLLR